MQTKNYIEISKIVLTFWVYIYIIGKENKRKAECGCHQFTKEEVVCMIEIALLHIIKLLFTALVAETIITFALIIALVVIISK